ncbi:MAG: exo-alpha-sialidase [Candidatus Pacebacteria bacterium]|nr:exo-alpha-sialidase [Candidatus Paceibacterota bacterium]
MSLDVRHIETGREIPSEGYCDQPYVVVNADGSWTCLLTTGVGHEGASGQHVVAAITGDQGKTWSQLYDIEPATGPEASWVMPLRVPETGRIYAFYTYNKENQREVKTVDGGTFNRVDSFGTYAYRYSDDCGRTWSTERYEIPMRLFECDRENAYAGNVMFFWGVGKPFTHKGAAYVCASKVGGFGTGFFAQNEGVLFRSPNLLTEHDPANHVWETLPEGEVGLRTPPGGGPIAGEFNATPMNDGSLYGTFRTIDGWSCHAYSRDDGRNWDIDWMTYTPGGRRVKNPRSANFVRRFSNGKYLYWFCFNGGEILGRSPGVNAGVAYNNRNPIWLCGGVEKDGRIHWSQPEIILYDDKIGNRMSYPDFIEDNGRVFITETQKTIARVHELDSHVLEAMWNQHETCETAAEGLVLDLNAEECAAGSVVDMPELPSLHNRAADYVDADTGATLGGSVPKQVESRGGFALEFRVRFDDLDPWQVLFDSRGEEGRGVIVRLTDHGTLKLYIVSRAYDTPGSTSGNGMVEAACECDRNLLRPGCVHQVLFSVDGGPKIMSVMVDGVLCDGGSERQFGWSRFHPNLMSPNGAPTAKLAPSLHGALERVRLYDRYLLTSEGVANYRAR